MKNIEAEKCLLGIAINFPETIPEISLTPLELFYSYKARELFKAICSLKAARITIPELREQLLKQGAWSDSDSSDKVD
ncbi:MAG: DnaB-like helicase N-terminal domain-containing protein, partial [Desulfurococcaceae archaeon]